MPHSRQAKKRLRQSVKRKDQNRAVKSTMKTHVKKVLKAVAAGDAAAARAELPAAMKKIDKAAKKNVIHANQASRRIGRLSKKVSALEKQAGGGDAPSNG